jgi:hypothetical protein
MNKKQTTHWLKVAVIGIALGLGLQFVRAWTEPTTAPPGGNVGAPINTGAQKQVKAGDICTTVTGAEKCLSTAGSSTTCNNNGTCDTAAGETTANCPGDCPYVQPAPVCDNDGFCEDFYLESFANCPGDCCLCGSIVWNYTLFSATTKCGSSISSVFGDLLMTMTCLYPGVWGPAHY